MRVEDAASTAQAARPASARGTAGASRDDPRALREACEQFEAVFLAYLLQKMRDTVPEDPLLGESRAHDVYQSMLDWELAQQMARTQSVGLADMLFRQLSGLTAHAAPPQRTAPAVQPPASVAPLAPGEPED